MCCYGNRAVICDANFRMAPRFRLPIVGWMDLEHYPKCSRCTTLTMRSRRSAQTCGIASSRRDLSNHPMYNAPGFTFLEKVGWNRSAGFCWINLMWKVTRNDAATADLGGYAVRAARQEVTHQLQLRRTVGDSGEHRERVAA